MTETTPGPRTMAVDLAIALPLLAVVAWFAADSLSWRIRSDVPMMMYQAFLMNEHGWMPYRDVFDMNLPGSYALYALIGRVFGYGDLGLRVADLLVAGTTAGLLAVLGRTVASRRAGLLGATLFGAWHLRGGAILMLQRDGLGMALVLAAVAAAWRAAPGRGRTVAVGLLFGFTAGIKPHLLLGLLPTVAYLWATTPAPRRVRELVLPGLVALAVPGLVLTGWLVATGALGPFLDGLPYLRFYGAFGGNHVLYEGWDGLAYRVRKWSGFDDWTPWLAVAGLAIGLAAAEAEAARARKLQHLAGLLVAYALYPLSTGHYWAYEWMPMVTVACLGVALLTTVPLAGPRAALGRAARGVLLLLVVQASNGPALFHAFRVHQLEPGRGRPDAIADWLRENLRPGDRVQPMDWVSGGVLHGLLRAEAVAATRFLQDFHFHHHVSAPYQQRLQRAFLAEVRAAAPRVVVRATHGRPYFTGPDSAKAFPAAERWLEEDYDRAVDGPGYAIWVRRGD